MRIDIRLDPDRLMRWQAHIVEMLVACPSHTVGVSKGRAQDWPKGTAVLFRLEQTLFGSPTDDPIASVEWSTLKVAAGTEMPDLRLDLAGDGEPDRTPMLRILADGQRFEIGALAAVLERRAPVLQLAVITDHDDQVVGSTSPATENPRLAHAAFGMILGRAADMMIQAVRDFDTPVGLRQAALPASMPNAHRSPAYFFAETLAGSIGARINRLLGRAPNWFVATRQQVAAGLPQINAEGFTRLPDDGRRFYADPFLWQFAGKRYLFVEELPLATGKGIISVAEIDEYGRPASPRPVLETGCHLSYPFLFTYDNAIWMIPETSARRTVELYRADPFPNRWTLHSVMIQEADLGDVTLHQIDGIWWMFAASKARWTSSWDALSLFHAPGPFGPWTPHARNPVLVDVRSARPAGRLLAAGSRLVRPVQNSAKGYGSALGFAAVDLITSDDYVQTVISEAPPWSPNTGLHTYNRSASMEAIDLFGPRR